MSVGMVEQCGRMLYAVLSLMNTGQPEAALVAGCSH